MEVYSIQPVAPLILAGLAGMLTLVNGDKKFWRNLYSTVASILAFAFVASMIPGTLQGTIYTFKIADLIAGLSINLRVDSLGLVFGMVSSSMWVFVNIYTIGYMEHEENKKRFFAFFALSIFCAQGIAYSENLFSFLLFYELLSICTYPLVMHVGTEEAMKAGSRYLIYTLGGGGFLLVAIFITYMITGGNLTLSQPGILHITSGETLLKGLFFLYLIGVGVKAAIMPFHHWLPSAMIAPTPVSTLLHAVAVVKAGVFGVLRVIYSVYGFDLMKQLGLGQILAIIGSFTIITASLIAIRQNNLKRRLAYSTISQLSFIVTAGAILSPVAAIGAMVHIANHAFTKGTLFMCAGIVMEETGVKDISQMKGIARRLPWTMAIFTIAALGMIGFPPFAGFITEWYFGWGALQGNMLILIAVLVVNGVLDALYFMPIIYTAYFDKPDKERPFEKAPKETTWMMLGPIAGTSAMTLILGIFAGFPGLPLSVARYAQAFLFKS